MATITNTIRWADNTAELKANLLQGIGTIDAMKSSVDRTVASLSGQGLFGAANKATAAVLQMGGANKLTQAEQDRLNTLLEKAIEKYSAMGLKAPPAMIALAEATKQGNTETTNWLSSLQSLGNSWVARIAEGMLLRDAIREVLHWMKDLITAIPELGIRGSEVTAVRHGFEGLAGSVENADAIMVAMRAGSKNTIDDFTLMKDATKLLSASVKLNADDFGTLTEASRVLAHRGFGDTTEILGKLSDALITGRTKTAAKMLGVIDAKGAELEYQTTLGTGIDKLTAVGKAEAVREALLGKLRDTVKSAGEQELTFAERITQAKTSFTNFTDAIAVAIATSPVLKLAMEAAGDTVKKAFGDNQVAVVQTFIGYVNRVGIALIDVAKIGVDAATGLAIGWHAANKVVGDLIQIVEGDRLALEVAALGVAKFGAQFSSGQAARERYAADVVRIQGNIDALLSSMTKRGAALQDEDKAQHNAIQTGAQYQQKLDDLRAKMVAAAAQGVTNAHVFNAIGKAHADAEASAAAHEKAVSQLLQTLTGSSKQAGVAADAFSRLTDEQKTDSDVAAGLIPIVDKLVNSHQQVPLALMNWYTAALITRDAINSQQAATLAARGITLEYIESQQLAGQTEQEMATMLGVSVSALKAYTAGLKIFDDIHKQTYQLAMDHEKQWRDDGIKAAADKNKEVVAGYDEIRKAEIATTDLINQRTLSSTDYQIAKIVEWADQTKRAFKGTAEQAAAFYAQINQQAALKLADIYVDTKTLESQSIASLQATADRAYTTYLSMKARSGEFSKAAVQHQKDVADAAQKAVAGMYLSWHDSLGKLSTAFVQLAQVSGDAWGGIAKDIGTAVVNLNNAITAGEAMKQAMSEWSTDKLKSTVDTIAAWATAIAGTVQAVAGAKTSGQKIGIAIAAGIGAAIGAYYGGPAGAALGMAIGTSVATGFVEAFGDATRKGIEHTVEGWGHGEIGRQLATEIADQADRLFRGNEVAAITYNLKAVINELGGLNAMNLDAFTHKLRDVFVLVENGQMTTAQAAKTLDENWANFVTVATDGDGRISASLKEIIALNDRLGTQSKEIAKWQAAQGDAALSAFAAVAAGFQPMVDDWSLLKQKIDLLKTPVKDLTDAQKKLMEQFGLTAGDTKLLNIMLKQQGDLAKYNKDDLAALGVQAVATFAAAVASGKSTSEAMAEIHPALAMLSSAYAALGLDVDDVGLKTLLMRDKIITAAPELENAIGGLSQEMIALSNMGLMNVKTLEAIERTGVSMYEKLKVKVHELGGTDEDALKEMQVFLHNAAKEAEALGVPLDANTQAMIDQSKKAGIWQEALTPQDKLLKGMQSLVDKVAELVDRLNGIPPKINTTVTTTYQSNGPAPNPRDPESAATGGFVTAHGIQHLAGGGNVLVGPWMPRGTDTVPAMLTPGELVLSRGDAAAYRGSRNSGGSTVIDFSELKAELTAQRKALSDLARSLPAAIGVAVRDNLAQSRGLR